MRRCRLVPAVGLAVLASAWTPGCAKPSPPAVAPSPAGMPAPPARDVSSPEAPPISNPDLVKLFTSRGLDAREEGAGVVIYLPTVYLFPFDKAEVDEKARAQLKDIAALLGEPMLAGRRITVEGHADSVGSRSYNQQLSEARARAVMDVLESGGVARSRLSSRAYGKDRPIEPNQVGGKDNPEGRARNRRVALVIENPQ